jgi:hypothetical protein
MIITMTSGHRLTFSNGHFAEQNSLSRNFVSLKCYRRYGYIILRLSTKRKKDKEGKEKAEIKNRSKC